MTPRELSLLAAKDLPDRLKAARKAAGLTQDQLVAIAECAPVTLSKLETGVNRPTFEVLVSLAHSLNASPNYLTGWEDEVGVESDAARRQLIGRLNLAVRKLSTEWIEQLIQIAERLEEDQSRS